METLWQELLALHAYIGLFVILWSLMESKMPSRSLTTGRVGPGVLLGLVAIWTMVMAVSIQPGFRFDLRHALIAASGFLFGPVAAVVTATMAAAARLSYGGGGMAAGLLGIAFSTVIGAVGHRVLGGRLPSIVQCIVFSVVISAGALLSLIAIPNGVRSEIFAMIWLPLVVLTFTSTLFTSYLVSAEFARRREHRYLQYYRDMVDSLPDCLNIKDLEGRFILANKATADLMKAKSPAELIDRSDFDFYPATVAAGYREQELAVMKAGLPQRLEQLVDFKDGKIGWLETVKVPLRDRHGKLTALVTYNRDSTELHALNEKKEQFIATMSHEIRTPLTSICGSLRLVSKAFAADLPHKADDMIDRADRNAQHLSELINNLLDFEKFNSGQMDFTPQTVDMASLVGEAVSSMKHFLPNKRLHWSISNGVGQAHVCAHPVRLRQVLLNLMSNAAKYAPARSTVEVEITRRGDILRVCVLDEGPGVQPEFESSLFHRFQQEKVTAALNTANGTGLGLSLIKSFVEHMSGEVGYRRRDDRTEFRVDLPASVPSEHAESGETRLLDNAGPGSHAAA